MESDKEDSFFFKISSSKCKFLGDEEFNQSSIPNFLLRNGIEYDNDHNWQLNQNGKEIDEKSISEMHFQSSVNLNYKITQFEKEEKIISIPYGEFLFEINVESIKKRVKLITNQAASVNDVILSICERYRILNPEKYTIQANGEVYLTHSKYISSYKFDEEVTLSMIEKPQIYSTLVLFPNNVYHIFQFQDNFSLDQIIKAIAKKKSILSKKKF
jgi:hypothetical protein